MKLEQMWLPGFGPDGGRREEMNHPRLQIIRGLPGSGKTTLACRKWPGLMKLELDQFCYSGGRYVWNETVNKLAKRRLYELLREITGMAIDLVVTGVFSFNAESIRTVIKIALYSGYDVWIKTMDERGRGTDVHRCNPEHYDRMKAGFRPDSEIVADVADLVKKTGYSVYVGCMPEETAE